MNNKYENLVAAYKINPELIDKAVEYSLKNKDTNIYIMTKTKKSFIVTGLYLAYKDYVFKGYYTVAVVRNGQITV